MTVITRRTLDREALLMKREVRQLKEFLDEKNRRTLDQSQNFVRSDERAQDSGTPPRLKVIRSA